MTDHQLDPTAIMAEAEGLALTLTALGATGSAALVRRLADALAAAQERERNLASYLPECMCAMSESSMNSCKVHGPDSTDLVSDLWHVLNDPYSRAALAGEGAAEPESPSHDSDGNEDGADR